MRRLLAIALALCTASFPKAVLGQEPRVVDGDRILLSDVAPSAPARLRLLDLGPAPPPGTTRLVTVDDVRAGLRRADEEPNAVDYRSPVRVMSAVRTIEPLELAKLVEPAIQAALPEGVTLVRVAPTIPLRTTPRATIGKATLPSLPRRSGQTRSTAVVEFMDRGLVLARIPVPITVDVSAKASRPDVARGATVRVYFESDRVVVSTLGVVLNDANIGDLIRVTVASTRRVVRAQLVSAQEAKVVP